jgi:hypothetical protein
MRNKILIGIGVFLAVIVVIVGVVIFLATRPIEEPPENFKSALQQDNSTKLDTLVNIKKEVEKIQQSPGTKTTVFVITEEEANTNMSKIIGSQPIVGMTLTDAHIYFREGFIESAMKAEVRGIPMDIVMKYTIEIINSETIVTVQSVNAGLLPVPVSKEQLGKNLSIYMAKILKDNGLNPYNPTIQVTTGKFTVTSQVK